MTLAIALKTINKTVIPIRSESGTARVFGDTVPASNEAAQRCDEPGERVLQERATRQDENVLITSLPLYAVPTRPHAPDVGTAAHGTFSSKLPNVKLTEVLDDSTARPVTLADYRQYLLEEEYGSEVLDFYVAVKQLHLLSDEGVLTTRIGEIVEDYIRAGYGSRSLPHHLETNLCRSVNEINVSPSSRVQVRVLPAPAG